MLERVRRSIALRAAVVGVAYAALAFLMWRIDPTWGSAFWPGAGLTFAVLVRSSRSSWVPLLVAVALAELCVDMANHTSLSTGLWGAAANTVEPLIGATLYLHFAKTRTLQNVRCLFVLLCAGAIVGPLFGAVLGGVFVTHETSAPVIEQWIRWFVGDGVGVIAVAPALLIPGKPRLREPLPELLAALVALGALLATFVWANGAVATAAPYLVMPVLLWLSVRFGTVVTAILTALVALSVHAAVATGHGVFATTPNAGLVVAQVYIGVVSISALTVALLMEDLLSRRAAEQALVHRALHDPLTGVGNRAMLDDRVEFGEISGVIAVDLDHFKQVNDQYGHDAGDQVLRQVAARLSTVSRRDDAVVRSGGDEFVLLLAGPVDDTALREITSRLRSALDAPYDVDGHSLEIRASIGVVGSSRSDVSTLLRAADRAMYDDKCQERPLPSRMG